jgi:hypothetical protein
MNDRAASPALLQAAASIVGRTRLAAAGKDGTRLKEALQMFALACSLGPPGAKEDPEDYAAAALGAAKCYAALGSASDKEPLREEYKARASGYCREVQRAYKGTGWASAAHDLLVELGEERAKEGAAAPRTPEAGR